MEGHFYYSESQKQLSKRICCIGSDRETFCIVDGEELEYTEMISSGENKSKWKDAMYLGYGKFSRTGGKL